MQRFSNLSLTLAFLFPLLITAFLFSCTLKPEIFNTARERPMYRSDDYVLVPRPDAESPELLARKFLKDPAKAWVIQEANAGAPYANNDYVVVPLRQSNRGGLQADGFQTIPILTYHRFAERCTSPLCMPREVFDRQMRYLKENGYHVVSPADLLAFLEYRQPLPRKSVVITMDDGYRSVYKIGYPVLKKYGFTATLFIYTRFVGVSHLAITWEQLRHLKSEGFTIGSHTIDHSDLTRPQEGEDETAFIQRIYRELQDSKKILDQKLQQDTIALAYPFGYYDYRVGNIAREAGYKIAMSVNRGGNPFFANPMFLKRDQILHQDMDTFISRLKTFEPLALK